MQTLRHAPWITRLVLVWFALFIGAAAASPLIKTEGMQMVCTGMGSMKLVNLDADKDGGAPVLHGMDCPLCMPVVAPAPAVLTVHPPCGLGCVLHPTVSVQLASLIGLPWRARGPPSLPV